MENKELYINFRKSLDSYRDVLLAEIELINDEGEKEQFAVAVNNKIKVLLREIAKTQGPAWEKLNAAQAAKFTRHAQALTAAKAPGDCPPGFELIDGICVRI